MVDFPLRLPKQQHCVLEGVDIVLQKRCNSILQHMPVIGRKMAHHPEIEPDDFSSRNPNISGMRIGVEKSVLQDLLTVIFRCFRGNFFDIIAVFS